MLYVMQASGIGPSCMSAFAFCPRGAVSACHPVALCAVHISVSIRMWFDGPGAPCVCVDAYMCVCRRCVQTHALKYTQQEGLWHVPIHVSVCVCTSLTGCDACVSLSLCLSLSLSLSVSLSTVFGLGANSGGHGGSGAYGSHQSRRGGGCG
jgi:hypothetical protein